MAVMKIEYYSEVLDMEWGVNVKMLVEGYKVLVLQDGKKFWRLVAQQCEYT